MFLKILLSSDSIKLAENREGKREGEKESENLAHLTRNGPFLGQGQVEVSNTD